MNLQDIQKKETKPIVITLRITKEESDFLKKENISPTKLFNQALAEVKGIVKKKS